MLVVLAGVCLLLFAGVVTLGPKRVKLQATYSPDNRHSAELIRQDSLDRNYIVRVDGRRVYVSADFAPRGNLPYREALLWDKTGRIVVLEIARHRLFGYDADQGRRLSEDELLGVELPPDPPLWEYYFEAEWPGIGRVRTPQDEQVSPDAEAGDGAR